MLRKRLFLFTALLGIACWAQAKPGRPSGVLAIYQRANGYFNSTQPSSLTDSLALTGFTDVINAIKVLKEERLDTLLFDALLKKGILLDVKNETSAAKDLYLQAAAIPQRNHQLSDSLMFKPYVYAGTDYFNLNNFDSANFFLIRAERLVKTFPHLPETERLYNTLGALHYVNGNYLQSKNYFDQALEFVLNKQPVDKAFAQGLEANIATSYYKMGDYKAALAIYSAIVRERIPAGYIYNGIYMNMGKAWTAMGNHSQALACYKKIKAADAPAVLNELALSYLQLGRSDLASAYLDKLQAIKKDGSVNVLDIGINCLYRAGMLTDQKKYMSALLQLQNAIEIFAGNNSHDIYWNPSIFSGSYTYYRLFDALYKKAQLFNLLYRTVPSEKYLSASLDAFNAAITLLGCIEKSYDTDDAKLFLKKKSGQVYGEALLVCLQLYALHPAGGYLQQAFLISEKNKASVMAASIWQRNGAEAEGADQSFLQTERNIKFAIARLDIKSEEARNTAEIKKLAAEKAKYETQLSELQKSLEQNSGYFQYKYHEDFLSPDVLRRQLNSNEALFSFYFTGNVLHVFSFTSSGLKYKRIENAAGLTKEVEQWIGLLKAPPDGRKFNGGESGQRLYTHLVQPLQSLEPGKKEWIIVPDADLFLLPFESLPDGSTGKYMLETTTISYQFSSRFITAANTTKRELPMNVLSFAPFAGTDARYANTGPGFINRLPASAQEIDGLSGTAFLDADATKAAFLQQASKFPVIHLATHAVADVLNPGNSFIAFYPNKKTSSENFLYLEEIYGLNLDACKLVVISACETGKGELVHNEGVMSLSRAFTYAGCAATVNSLWKADDKATAAILQRFHAYLEEGDTKSKALQKAKLDYLHSDALYKSPAYWSNLVLTGNTESIYGKKSTASWLITLIGLVTAGGMAWLIERGKKSRRFSRLL